MDFKAVRRTDKNVVFGVAAAKQALADSGPRHRRRQRARTSASSSAPASAARRLMQDAIETCATKGPKLGQPVLHRQHAARHGVRPDRHRDGRQGPQHVHRDGLLDGHPQHRRGGRGHPARRLHRGHLRLDGDAALRGRLRRLLQHARHGHAARGPAADGHLAAVRPHPRRLRARRGRRRPGRSRTSSSPRRAAPRSTPRSWATAPRPMPGTSSSPSTRATACAAPWRWHSSATACRATRSTSSTRTAPRRRWATCARREAIWAVFGDRTPEIAISATKSLTGHLMGAAGAVEGVFTVLSVHHQVAPGDAQLPGAGSRRSTSTSSTASRARWRSATP